MPKTEHLQKGLLSYRLIKYFSCVVYEVKNKEMMQLICSSFHIENHGESEWISQLLQTHNQLCTTLTLDNTLSLTFEQQPAVTRGQSCCTISFCVNHDLRELLFCQHTHSATASTIC